MEEIIFGKRDRFLDKLMRRKHKIVKSWKRGKFFRRTVNYFLVKAAVSISVSIGKPYVWGFPFYLMIEPTNICNLKCPLCPTGEGTLERKEGLMDFSTLKMAVDELGDYLLEVNITNYGEPLINKQIYDMVAYIKEKGIRIMLGTNGHYFGEESEVERLILSGVDEIYVSLDGTTQDTYARYRVGGDFKKVVEGLRLLVEMRNKLDSSLPIVELQFLVMRHNENQIPDIRKLAMEIGVDRLILKPVSFNVSQWHNKGVQETFKEFMPQDEAFRLYRIEDGRLQWKHRIKNRCDYLWRGMVILWDGTVVPCCLDPRGDYKMGEVKGGIMKIWNSPGYINLRKQILTDKRKLPLCSHCPGT